jgi:Holliday junction DNA helicase RuvA
MIAYVKGLLEHAAEGQAVVDVNGVGYLVHISNATLSRLPSLGNEVKLFTYMQVKEDAQSLHGFLTREELRMFILLISVSGIGPKVASGILSTFSPSQLIIAIVADDSVLLSKAPGVGKKTAQRLALELRDQIKTNEVWEQKTPGSPSTGALAVSGEKQDAMDALAALGYSRGEGMQAVLETAEDGMTAQEIIRLSLKKLVR